jgi:hypothetical protein
VTMHQVMAHTLYSMQSPSAGARMHTHTHTLCSMQSPSDGARAHTHFKACSPQVMAHAHAHIHTHSLQHAVPHLCSTQYCRLSSVICCYAERSCFADSTSLLGLKLYILYYFLLSLHKLSITHYLYNHTPPSKGRKMLNDRNTKGNSSEEDINGLKS